MSEVDDDSPDLLPLEPIEEATQVAGSLDLAALHGTLAKAMRVRIKSGRATAAEWNAAAKFLADNGITTKSGENEKLKGLKDLLDQKRRRTVVGNADRDAAAEAFDRNLGK